jgi:hypothetical protein
VRATLHDELMREAGFETDRSLKHAGRRRQRRQRLRRAMREVAVAGPLVWLAAGTVEWMGGHVPRALFGVALAAGVVGTLADWLLGRVARDEGEQPRRRLLRMWKGITRPWREAQF